MAGMKFGRRARLLLLEWIRLRHSPNRDLRSRGSDLSVFCELLTVTYTPADSTRLADGGFSPQNSGDPPVRARGRNEGRSCRFRANTPIDASRHPGVQA